jgi:hypothetical protein
MEIQLDSIKARIKELMGEMGWDESSVARMKSTLNFWNFELNRKVDIDYGLEPGLWGAIKRALKIDEDADGITDELLVFVLSMRHPLHGEFHKLGLSNQVEALAFAWERMMERDMIVPCAALLPPCIVRSVKKTMRRTVISRLNRIRTLCSIPRATSGTIVEATGLMAELLGTSLLSQAQRPKEGFALMREEFLEAQKRVPPDVLGQHLVRLWFTYGRYALPVELVKGLLVEMFGSGGVAAETSMMMLLILQ